MTTAVSDISDSLEGRRALVTGGTKGSARPSPGGWRRSAPGCS
ncbi:hypothetical protein ACFVGN_37040 [Streptomyces sp. NPDC057757]